MNAKNSRNFSVKNFLNNFFKVLVLGLLAYLIFNYFQPSPSAPIIIDIKRDFTVEDMTTNEHVFQSVAEVRTKPVTNSRIVRDTIPIGSVFTGWYQLEQWWSETEVTITRSGWAQVGYYGSPTKNLFSMMSPVIIDNDSVFVQVNWRIAVMDTVSLHLIYETDEVRQSIFSDANYGKTKGNMLFTMREKFTDIVRREISNPNAEVHVKTYNYVLNEVYEYLKSDQFKELARLKGVKDVEKMTSVITMINPFDGRTTIEIPTKKLID